MSQWYRFGQASTDATVAEIHIVDFIGDWYQDASNRFWGESMGVTARAFVDELSKLPSTVKALRVHINSPGGDVQAGINIANALREQASKGRTVETVIDGIAASIASVIAMAGTKVTMADNALMMIHDPWSVSVGSAAEMRKTADVLDAMRNQIVATYKWHASIEDAAIVDMMAAETWMGADEALAAGFVTDVVKGLSAAASLPRAAVARLTVPAQFQARFDALVERPAAPVPVPAPYDALAVLASCREAGAPELAEDLIRVQADASAVAAKIAQATEAKAAASARAAEITALCETARVPELAAAYIAGGMALAQVREQLVIVTAKLDAVEIDGGILPDRDAPGRVAIDTAAVYQQLNAPTSH